MKKTLIKIFDKIIVMLLGALGIFSSCEKEGAVPMYGVSPREIFTKTIFGLFGMKVIKLCETVHGQRPIYVLIVSRLSIAKVMGYISANKKMINYCVVIWN